MRPEGQVKLKEGKEKKLRSHYPWVMREEVRRVEGNQDAGLVRVLDSTGEPVGIGFHNPASRFPVRMLTLQEEEIDEAFFARKLQALLEAKQGLRLDSDSFRLCFAEADAIPGLIVDWYQGRLVVQVRSLGMEALKHLWLPGLAALPGVESILERSEMAGREEEGLDPVTEELHGQSPDTLWIRERGLEFLCLLRHGLKTGFYLDQRNTRARLEARVRPGDAVLDCFCYTGGFALSAARAGARATALDILPLGLEALRENATRNGLEVEAIEANAFEWLETGEIDQQYDWIILDPPAIAKTAEKRNSLKWGIWKLAYHALPRLKPGGRLVVCSCSFQVNQGALVDVCRLAASDRGVRLALEEVTLQDLDHTALTQFPESLYLKCAWMRRLN